MMRSSIRSLAASALLTMAAAMGSATEEVTALNRTLQPKPSDYKKKRQRAARAKRLAHMGFGGFKGTPYGSGNKLARKAYEGTVGMARLR